MIEAAGETHHFLQAVENVHVAVDGARDQHVEAIRSEIDRGDRLRLRRPSHHRAQRPKDPSNRRTFFQAVTPRRAVIHAEKRSASTNAHIAMTRSNER